MKEEVTKRLKQFFFREIKCCSVVAVEHFGYILYNNFLNFKILEGTLKKNLLQ
jgi:hypothetical protein